MQDDISLDALDRWTRRRDGPATMHLAIQLAALLATAASTASLAARDHPARWPTSFACGVAVLTFFPLLHESSHRTAFKSGFGNGLGIWLGALMMLQAPSFFRDFHWEHHRSTQDPDSDPEISGMPALLDGYPTNPITYLFLVSGQFLMVGKLGFTIACAFLPVSVWSGFFPFIRSENRPRVATESRIALLILASVLWVGFSLVPGFGVILLAWPISHLILGFYLMPEHTGLPNSGDQFNRTRTVASNALVRRLMWNMPYHTEHHVHPGIPYHAMPALHAELTPKLRHTSRGYLCFHLDAAARALRLR
ncbi:MAG: hypothetical protein GY910_04165 [bacterium]|nr:hypothetical protein [bacterium]